MNFNNDYQKSRGLLTSFPRREIIRPNRKYLVSNSFYQPTNFLYFSEHLEKYRKIKGINLHKKKTSISKDLNRFY